MTFYNFTVELTNKYGSYVLQYGHKYAIDVCVGSGHGACGHIHKGILEGVFTSNRGKIIRIIDFDDSAFKTCIYVEEIVGIKELES